MVLATEEHHSSTLCEAKGESAGDQSTILDAVREWKGVGENLLASLGDWVSDIEARQKNLRLTKEYLERERENEVRKGELGPLLKEIAKENELREEKLDKQLKLVNAHIQSLEEAQNEVQGLKFLECEKLKDIERREREVCLTQQSLENRLTEIEQREKEVKSFTERKLRELVLKEEDLSRKKAEFINKVELADEKFRESEKLGIGLIERLDSALYKLEGMKVTIDEKFEEMTTTQKSLIVIADEADSILEQLEKRIQEFEKMERGFKENKMQNSGLKNQHLSIIRAELLNEVKLVDKRLSGQQEVVLRLLERVDELMGKKVNKVESPQLTQRETFYAKDDVRLKEVEKREGKFHLHQEEKEREGRKLGLVVGNQEKGIRANGENRFDIDKLHQPEWEVKLMERNGESSVSGVHELKQLQLTDTHLPMGPAGLKRSFDLRRLEMIIKNTEDDFELMSDQVSRFLPTSSDPPILVLDSIQWFHTFHLGNGDSESNMRRICILLLEQLIERPAKVHPRVREAAAKLANEWKSKIIAADENPLQVLEFLHLLAAYNLSSSFSKDELLGFLRTVAQHKRTPELCRLLNLTDNMEGFVQNLIREKQYLLASTYIHECKHEKMFSQAAVLDYYVKHVNMLTKAKCRREHFPIETKVKAIADEIADVRAAIQHIVKYSLESEYSPDILMDRIQLLETNLASLKNGVSMPPPTDIHKLEIGEISPRFRDASKRKVRRIAVASNEATLIPRSELLEHDSEGRTGPPAWQPQKRHAPFHEPLPQVGSETNLLLQTTDVDEWPMNHGNGSHKRHKTNLRDFGTPWSAPNHNRLWR